MNTSHEVSDAPSLPSPDRSRSWWIFLAVATLAAALLRMAEPSRLAIEHFDEGVYASNFWCPDEGFSYPDRHLYAPPGLPRVIEEAHVWFRASDLSSIAPSLLAGIMLIPLLGLLARDWLGEPAARATVLLAVFNDIHILYSRTALTDVPWTTCLVLALWLTHRALISGKLVPLIAAGLATAVGWWTKYTGWLPLAIAAAGIVAVPILDRRPGTPWTTWLKRLAAISAVTAIAIAPLFVSLQQTGGYTVVASNHARYIVGLSGWLESAVAQSEHMSSFESLLTIVGVVMACWLAQAASSRFTWNAIRPRLLLAAAAAGLAALGSFAALVLAAAMLAIRDGLAELRGHQQPDSRGRSLAWTMLAAWWIAMTLTTPLYHPYPRLVLPWLIAGWLLLGRQIARWSAAGLPGEPPATPRHLLPLAGGIGLVLFLIAIPARFESRGIPALEPRTAIAGLADKLIAVVSRQAPDGNAVIRVWGEPALFFQLSNRSPARLLMQPAGGLKVIRSGDQPPEIPIFLVIGPHALDGRTPAPDAMREYEPISTLEITPGLQVRRNQPPARRERPMTFHLYRWKPGADVSRETSQAARRSNDRTTR